jgi:hypothetical protein
VLKRVEKYGETFDLFPDSERGRFAVFLKGEKVATCGDAKALSNWALNHGAAVVRWNGEASMQAEGRA